MSGVGKAGAPIGAREVEVAGEGSATALPEAPVAEARIERGRAPGAVPDVLGAGLVAEIMRRVPTSGDPSALPTGRDILYGAALLAAEKLGGSSAFAQFLMRAAHDQRALLGEVRAAAKEIGAERGDARATCEAESGRARTRTPTTQSTGGPDGVKLDRGGVVATGETHTSTPLTSTRTTGTARLDRDGLTATGEAEARAGIARSAAGSFRSGMLAANGRIAADAGAYVKAGGTAKVDRSGLRARGEAEVGARVRVAVDGDFATKGVRIGGENLNVNGRVRGEAEVSAYARADAEVAATLEPPRAIVVANGKAFAGAKAGATGSVGLGDFVRVNATAEAWAGAGAEGGIVAGYDDGKLRLGFHGGAAVGVGAGMSFSVEVDVKKIAASLLNAATGGVVNFSILLDRGAGLEPIELAQVELLFPPEVLRSGAAAGEIEVDLGDRTVRLSERKKQRASAERHIKAVVRSSLSAPGVPVTPAPVKAASAKPDAAGGVRKSGGQK